MKRHNVKTDRQTQLRVESRKARTKKRKVKLNKAVEKKTVHLGRRVGDLKTQLVATQRELTAAFNKIEELKAKIKPEVKETVEVQENKDAAK
jgi:hypothetical protein